jgi:hypothetical protein
MTKGRNNEGKQAGVFLSFLPRAAGGSSDALC